MVSAVCVLSILAGIILSLRGMWLGTVKEPKFRSDEPLIGIPFWKMTSYLSPRAYRTYVAGTTLIVLGNLLVVIRYWLL